MSDGSHGSAVNTMTSHLDSSDSVPLRAIWANYGALVSLGMASSQNCCSIS